MVVTRSDSRLSEAVWQADELLCRISNLRHSMQGAMLSQGPTLPERVAAGEEVWGCPSLHAVVLSVAWWLDVWLPSQSLLQASDVVERIQADAACLPCVHAE